MKVVMLDDSPTFLIATERLLAAQGIQVFSLSSWMDIGPAVQRHRPDVLILSFNMSGGFDGPQIGQIFRRFSECPILFLSSEPTERLTAACDSIANSWFVEKGNLRAELVPKLLSLCPQETGQGAVKPIGAT